jgi:hypothetical protein
MLFFTSSKVVALGERFQKTYRPSKPSIITFDYGAKCFLGRTKHILREEVRRKRYALVDTLGLHMKVPVTAGNVQDRESKTTLMILQNKRNLFNAWNSPGQTGVVAEL